MNKAILIIGIIMLLMGSSKAQNPLSLYYLENVPQTTIINPAMTPRANAFFGVPILNSIYTGVSTDMFGPDIIQKVDGKYVSLLHAQFDYSKLYDRIGESANISANQMMAPLVMGFSGKKGYFTFTWSEKVSQSMTLPKDFFSILDKGFPMNSDYSFSGLGTNAQYYRELSFGYSYNFMSKLRIGVHAKYLQGLAAVKSDINKFDIEVGYQTDAERHPAFDVDVNGDIYISGPITIETDEDGEVEDIGLPKFDLETIKNTAGLNFSNPGLAFDVGFKYDYTDAWSFSGSVNDLGFIRWNGDLNSISADGGFTYSGIEIDGSDLANSGDVLTELIDSIKQSWSAKLNNKSFSTGLGPKVYLGAQYKVNHYFSAGFLSRTRFVKNNFSQEFNVSANLNLYHVLTATVNYTVATSGANTIGFGFALRGGPLQFYMAADYFPYSYRSLAIKTTDEGGNPVEIPFTPTQFDNFNVMFGLNLLFGANGFRDDPMIDAYNEF